MNRNYKVIWNQSLNCFMAVAEYAKSRGKSSGNVVSSTSTASGIVSSGVRLLRLNALSLGLIGAGLSMQVMAAPNDSDMIAQNTADITINRDAIATNTNDIATNSNAIATNAGNIDTNKTNIIANTNAISTNTTNIAEVRTIANAGWNVSAEGGGFS